MDFFSSLVSNHLAHVHDFFQLYFLSSFASELLDLEKFFLYSVSDPLIGHMEMVTEIVVPTVCTLCILLSAVFLMFLLRGRF